MKHIILFTLCLLSLNVRAQENFDFSKKQIPVWELAKENTIAVARAMPENNYKYTPVEGVKSFGQQMTHISNSLLSMHTRFILKESYIGKEKRASGMTKTQIINDLEKSFNTVLESLKSLKDSDLQSIGKSGGVFSLTKWQSLLFMGDHITNHRAKAVLYLRLNNIKPPQYGYN
ncbi:MAG: DinB family protein [Psychroserpens sp.]|uniref:DinB family protein n=1 Tax=Psychroserpens sp. TaxID=2020870 RepID=UPI0030036C29